MEDFNWYTENSHSDNTETMCDYLENHLPDEYDILFQDGSYAEIFEKSSNRIWGCHASGRGDFNNHKVSFEFIH